jgi:hypothetical protein
MIPESDFEKLLIGDTAAPDMTRRIMGRLGFMRGSATAAARARRKSRLHRAAWVVTGALSGFIGWEMYQYSDMVRRPAAVTVSSAIDHDLAASGTKLNETVGQFSRLISLKSDLKGEEASSDNRGEAVGGSEGTHSDAQPTAIDANSAHDSESGAVERGNQTSSGSAAPLWMTPSDSSAIF